MEMRQLLHTNPFQNLMFGTILPIFFRNVPFSAKNMFVSFIFKKTFCLNAFPIIFWMLSLISRLFPACGYGVFSQRLCVCVFYVVLVIKIIYFEICLDLNFQWIFFYLPSYGSEMRQWYTLRLLKMCLEEHFW